MAEEHGEAYQMAQDLVAAAAVRAVDRCQPLMLTIPIPKKVEAESEVDIIDRSKMPPPKLPPLPKEMSSSMASVLSDVTRILASGQRLPAEARTRRKRGGGGKQAPETSVNTFRKAIDDKESDKEKKKNVDMADFSKSSILMSSAFRLFYSVQPKVTKPPVPPELFGGVIPNPHPEPEPDKPKSLEDKLLEGEERQQNLSVLAEYDTVLCWCEIQSAYDTTEIHPNTVKLNHPEGKTAHTLVEELIVAQLSKSYSKQCSSLPHPLSLLDTCFLNDKSLLQPFKHSCGLRSKNCVFPEVCWVSDFNQLFRDHVQSLDRRCVCDAEQICPHCKYFFYLLSWICHKSNTAFMSAFADVAMICNFMMNFAMVDPYAMFDLEDPCCGHCGLPQTVSEIYEGDMNDFPNCEEMHEKLFTKDLIMARLFYAYERVETLISESLACKRPVWNQYEIRKERKKPLDNGILSMAAYVEPIFSLVRLSTMLKEVTVNLSKLKEHVMLFPSWFHMEGSFHPINDVISVHKIYRINLFLLIEVVPEIGLGHLNGLNPNKAKRHRPGYNELQANLSRLQYVKRMWNGIEAKAKRAAEKVSKIVAMTKQTDDLEAMYKFHRFETRFDLAVYYKALYLKSSFETTFSLTMSAIGSVSVMASTMADERQKGDHPVEVNLKVPDVLSKWLDNIIAALIDTEKEVEAMIKASMKKKSAEAHSPAAFKMFTIRECCTFCGRFPFEIKKTMPENGEQFKMSTCRKCKIARYCTDACFKKHKYIHYLMCDRDNYITKLNSLVCLSDEVFNIIERFQAGEKFKRPIELPNPTLTIDDPQLITHYKDPLWFGDLELPLNIAVISRDLINTTTRIINDAKPKPADAVNDLINQASNLKLNESENSDDCSKNKVITTIHDEELSDKENDNKVADSANADNSATKPRQNKSGGKKSNKKKKSKKRY